MGCAPSKETEAASSSRQVPEAAKEEKKSETIAASPPEKSGTGVGITLVDLNDVIPGPTPGSRGRFLSYASGASTPTTSDGDQSPEGNEIPHKNGVTSVKSSAARQNEFASRTASSIGLDEIDTNAAGLTSKVVHIEVPFGKPIEEVYDGVHNGPILGSGVSGLVRLVTHKATGLQYAVKCLDLGLVGTKEGLAQLREEIFIMCQLDHPNIVRLEEVYESQSEIYLVQELCLGGELFDRLDEQPDYHYTEAECARLIKQMLCAVRYLHSKGIIHRDLKLENFLFSSKATDSELKMIDFGLSKHFRFGEVHHEAVGTPYTVAPEVILGSYDERCDIWAIGVIAFLLLSGEPPFGGCGGSEPLLTVRANILACKFEFEPDDIWCLVSDKAKEFVTSLLVLEPQNRPTAREAQRNPWIKEWASRQSTPADKLLNPNVVKALVNFKEFSDMRKLLSEVLSFTLVPHQIKELRKEFEKMDTDGSGEISLSALKKVLMANAGAGSLGALNEEEVEDIFDAMRVSKSETRIHWHEFIAAGLSQCQVDDRNLRLAFDRLDSDHKGYICLDDIINLVGNDEDELHSREQIRVMWMDSMKSVNCKQTHITYDDFLLLMKGQTKESEPEVEPSVLPLMSTPKRGVSLGPVPEGAQVIESQDQCSVDFPLEEEATSPALSTFLGDNHVPVVEGKNAEDCSVHSLPNMGGSGMFESSNSSLGLPSPSPDSPSTRQIVSDIPVTENTTLPDVSLPNFTKVLTRRRSQSLAEEKEAKQPDEDESPVIKPFIEESAPTNSQEQGQQEDHGLAKNKSALTVNRQLYRAHRQMRLSVLEASRKFEEEQARRARDTLIAQKLSQAGLVMRHGHKVQVTTENIRSYLKENKAEQQELVEKANRRGGRGRSSRKKTISDLNAMMNPSYGQDEMTEASKRTSYTPEISKAVKRVELKNLDVPDLKSRSFDQDAVPLTDNSRLSTVVVGGKQVTVDVPSLELIDKAIRKATVPGVFRETSDPFGVDGMYGGSRINSIDVNALRDPGRHKQNEND